MAKSLFGFNETVTFPVADSDWGIVTHAGLFNEDGELLVKIVLDDGGTRAVTAGDCVKVSLNTGFSELDSSSFCDSDKKSVPIYEPFTMDVTYDDGGIMVACPFCGETYVREIIEKKFVKGQWKTRTTYYYKCGTSKTVGDYKVKKPRVRISKNCVGFTK